MTFSAKKALSIGNLVAFQSLCGVFNLEYERRSGIWLPKSSSFESKVVD